jgi:hypothetical protein
MRLQSLASYVVGAMAAAALLAGCSGGTNSQLAPAGMQNGTTPSAFVNGPLAKLASVVSPKVNVQLRHVTGTHPINPDCCAYTKTLFFSDSGTNEIQMYKFPSNKYIGQLSPPPEGFSEPQGMCSDNKGDVFATNTGYEKIDEFSHNGTFIQAISDPGEYPVSCAFDKSTGNLAVGNIFTTADGAGSIAVYKNASGTPQIISGGNVRRVYFMGYAGKTGVLYFDGENSSYETAYGSMQNGKVTNLSITGGSVEFPGTVTWSAQTQTMNIGDQEGAVLYQISSTGNITGSTHLTGSTDIVQGTIKGPRFVGPDAGNGSVEVFAYPAGGSAKSTITGLSEPIGSAISPNVP